MCEITKYTLIPLYSYRVKAITQCMGVWDLKDALSRNNGKATKKKRRKKKKNLLYGSFFFFFLVLLKLVLDLLFSDQNQNNLAENI